MFESWRTPQRIPFSRTMILKKSFIQLILESYKTKVRVIHGSVVFVMMMIVEFYAGGIHMMKFHSTDILQIKNY